MKKPRKKALSSPRAKAGAPAGLSLALWAANLSHPVKNLAGFLALVEKQLDSARKKGCDMLILPEYASELWMGFAPKTLKITEELAWCADLAARAIPRLEALVEHTGVALVAGTLPWRNEKGRICNRAFALFPDRPPVFHDKLVLIPGERDPKGWNVATGNEINIFRWRGANIALLICLDIEMPALSCLLAKADVDLLIVPSFTEKRAGYHRVFDCAKARAVELMAAVAVVGCVGGAKKRTDCHSGAAVYLPCEEQFGHTGLHAAIPPHKATNQGPGRTLYAKNIPLARIHAARNGKAEVWPGAWTAGHVRVTQEG